MGHHKMLHGAFHSLSAVFQAFICSVNFKFASAQKRQSQGSHISSFREYMITTAGVLWPFPLLRSLFSRTFVLVGRWPLRQIGSRQYHNLYRASPSDEPCQPSCATRHLWLLAHSMRSAPTAAESECYRDCELPWGLCGQLCQL